MTSLAEAPLYTHAYAYDMASIIIDTANRAAAEPAKSVRELLEGTNLDGVTGKLKFDESGDLPGSVEIGVMRNGVAVPD